MLKTRSPKCGRVPNTCYKIVVVKFPVSKLKQKKAKKVKNYLHNTPLMLKTLQHDIAESIVFLDQLHFLQRSRPTAFNLTRKETRQIMRSAI